MTAYAWCPVCGQEFTWAGGDPCPNLAMLKARHYRKAGYSKDEIDAAHELIGRLGRSGAQELAWKMSRPRVRWEAQRLNASHVRLVPAAGEGT